MLFTGQFYSEAAFMGTVNSVTNTFNLQHKIQLITYQSLGKGNNLRFEGFWRIIGIPTFETKIFRGLASLATLVLKVLEGW